MNDLERDARRWLARYREEERPPPEVDVMIRTRIRRSSRGHARALWIGVWAVTAAAVLLILWVFDPRGSSLRSGRVAAFGARYTGISADTRALRDRPMQAPPPMSEPVEQIVAGPHALLEARRHMDVGDHDAALMLLRPCPQKVGTDALLEECELLVIEAMCKSGDLAGGRQQIALFRDGWPDSAHTKSLSEVCTD